MLALRQRLIELGITGYVEQQQVIQEIAWFIDEFKVEHKFHLKEITSEEALTELRNSLNSKKEPIDSITGGK